MAEVNQQASKLFTLHSYYNGTSSSQLLFRSSSCTPEATWLSHLRYLRCSRKPTCPEVQTLRWLYDHPVLFPRVPKIALAFSQDHLSAHRCSDVRCKTAGHRACISWWKFGEVPSQVYLNTLFTSRMGRLPSPSIKAPACQYPAKCVAYRAELQCSRRIIIPFLSSKYPYSISDICNQPWSPCGRWYQPTRRTLSPQWGNWNPCYTRTMRWHFSSYARGSRPTQ